MRRRPLTTGLLCALTILGLAAAGAGSLPSATAGTASYGTPVTIMLGGDSITQGFDGDYTWRYRLDRELRRQKVAFDFVGPRRYTYGGANHYAVTSGWDTDHDATGGIRLANALSSIKSDMSAYGGDHGPDVLVELYGTTDLLPRAADAPEKTVPLKDEIAALRDYIAKAREVNPNVDVVLGEVTTRRIPNRQAFNDAVHALAAEQDRLVDNSRGLYYPDSRVVVADLDYTGWDPTKYTYDTTHPTPAGEAVIAQRVAWALKSLGVLPSSPQISAAGLRYAPPWAPRISVSRTHRIVVNYYLTMWLNKPQMVRIRLENLRTHQSATTVWTASTRAASAHPDIYISSVKRAGYYQVRFQGRRQAMISPWSRGWTVHVGR